MIISILLGSISLMLTLGQIVNENMIQPDGLVDSAMVSDLAKEIIEFPREFFKVIFSACPNVDCANGEHKLLASYFTFEDDFFLLKSALQTKLHGQTVPIFETIISCETQEDACYKVAFQLCREPFIFVNLQHALYQEFPYLTGLEFALQNGSIPIFGTPYTLDGLVTIYRWQLGLSSIFFVDGLCYNSVFWPLPCFSDTLLSAATNIPFDSPSIFNYCFRIGFCVGVVAVFGYCVAVSLPISFF